MDLSINFVGKFFFPETRLKKMKPIQTRDSSCDLNSREPNKTLINGYWNIPSFRKHALFSSKMEMDKKTQTKTTKIMNKEKEIKKKKSIFIYTYVYIY